MAQVTDYASLVDNVIKYHDREGDTSFTSQVDTFIALAEAQFNRRIKSREMSATTTLTTDADGYATLPTDFIRARGFNNVNGNLSVPLSVIAQPAIASLFPINTGGIATYISISNGQIRIQTSAASAVFLEYDQRFVGLSATNTTNWVIERNPDLYLYAVLAQGSLWLKAYDEAALLKSQALEVENEMDEVYSLEIYNNAGVTVSETSTP